MATTALVRTFEHLQIDQEWSTRQGSRWSWLAHQLEQEFTVEGPFHSRGVDVIRISARVPLVRAATCPDDKAEKFVALSNRFAVADALLWNGQHRTLESHIAAVVHEETFEWRIQQFASLAIIQLITGEIRADMFAEFLGGEVATWAHPESGPRSVPDDMLLVIEQAFTPIGREPSRFGSREDFGAVEEFAHSAGLFTLAGDENQISLEARFGTGDTSLIEMFSNQAHRTLGSGLLCTTHVRVPPRIRTPLDRLASTLNWREAYGHERPHRYGAWCCTSDGEREGGPYLVHSLFLPNALYQPGAAVDVAMQAAARAAWLEQVLHASGEESDVGPQEIGVRRMIARLFGGSRDA